MTYEEAQAIHSSPMWDDVCKECDYRIHAIEKQLRVCSVENLPLLQKEISMWERFKNLPTEVMERIK